jgi:hypothetical protein
MRSYANFFHSFAEPTCSIPGRLNRFAARYVLLAPAKNASWDISGPAMWSKVQERGPWLEAIPMQVEEMICRLPACSDRIKPLQVVLQLMLALTYGYILQDKVHPLPPGTSAKERKLWTVWACALRVSPGSEPPITGFTRTTTCMQ